MTINDNGFQRKTTPTGLAVVHTQFSERSNNTVDCISLLTTLLLMADHAGLFFVDVVQPLPVVDVHAPYVLGSSPDELIDEIGGVWLSGEYIGALSDEDFELHPPTLVEG